jgi:hypothetical protein
MLSSSSTAQVLLVLLLLLGPRYMSWNHHKSITVYPAGNIS